MQQRLFRRTMLKSKTSAPLVAHGPLLALKYWEVLRTRHRFTERWCQKKIIFVKKNIDTNYFAVIFVMRRAIPHFGSTNLRGTFMTSIRVLNTQEQSAVSAKPRSPQVAVAAAAA
ncbi:hypothetical protein HG619_03570 [Pseudomonas syringae]|nr:hypothetical protein [Pseudomonas syringae]